MEDPGKAKVTLNLSKPNRPVFLVRYDPEGKKGEIPPEAAKDRCRKWLEEHNLLQYMVAMLETLPSPKGTWLLKIRIMEEGQQPLLQASGAGEI